MFTLTVFEILLFEGRSVLSPAQRGAGSETVNFHSLLFYSELNEVCGNNTGTLK